MQHSKIQQYCEGIIEAGWLAALIIAPLFFNTYSSRVFEPDKISLIRSISLVMLLAYLVKIIDGGRLWLPAGGVTPVARSHNPPPSDELRAGKALTPANLWKLPLLLPVLLLAASYALSTLLSISPSLSWWGSYHRLQGTYTFFSYLIIALLTTAHLRQPAQLRRLQHTIIITSLPIAIYGVFQHFDKDPLPWGQDVTNRIAGNAGNPIFLAAHLIMAFFLTLERVVTSFSFLLEGGSSPTTADDTAEDRQNPAPDYGLASVFAGSSYLFVLVVQLLAIFWSQSRGPWLGLASGIYIFVLLLLTAMRPRNYRIWTTAWVGLGVAGVTLLVLLNTTALGHAFRQVPIWGRLTTMLDSSGGTGRVRVLIWEGTSEMVSPHQPLTYPDGSQDPFNLLRPLIGYGPETTWMAFNRFYPSELAQLESRNASPDRAHNETWDSLAITGIFGFLASSLLYLSIFFWALRWLGLIRSRRDIALFLALLVGGGLLLSALFQLLGVSVGFLGVNWPTGLILGLIVFVTLAVFLQPESKTQVADRRRQLLLVASLAAIIAHYVEIHLGIAIAATRIYFWIIGAVLLVLGMRWLVPEPFALELDATSPGAARDEKRGGVRTPRSAAQAMSRRRRRQGGAGGRGWDNLVPATILPDLLVIMTLVFLFTTNYQRLSNPFLVLFRGLTRYVQDQAVSNGSNILWLVFFTWVIALVLGISTAILRQPGFSMIRVVRNKTPRNSRQRGEPKTGQGLGTALNLARAVVLYGLTLFAGWLLFGLIHAGRLLPPTRTGSLAEQLDHIAGHYGLFAWIVVFWCLTAGLVLAWRPILDERRAWMNHSLTTAGAAVLLSVTIFFIIGSINIAQVRADVFYKQGQNFDGAGAWVESSDLYRRALVVRPTEDHYLLFLGRSLLERATQAPKEGSLTLPAKPTLQEILRLDVQEIALLGQEDLLRVVRTVLLRAQELKPLNTDHTANLARLYRRWSRLTDDPQERMPAMEKSLNYYNIALSLSPNVAHLWNEQGEILASMGRLEEAESSLQHSLTIDGRFENTYLLLAELYVEMGETEKQFQLLDRGLEILPNSLVLLSHKGTAQSRAGDLEGALTTILEAFEKYPTHLNAARNLIVLSRLLDRQDEAIQWADQAIALIESGHGSNDVVFSTLRQIVELNSQSGRLQESVDILQRLMDLAPADYRLPFQLAHVHTQLGNNTQARQFGETALSLAPEIEKPNVQSFLDSLE